MRTDTEIDDIRKGKEIATVIGCHTVHCPIRESMTIACPVICRILDPIPPTTMLPSGPMDMEVDAMERTDTKADTLLDSLPAENEIPWEATLAGMLPTAYSRTDATAPRRWILQGIPICQTRGDHRADMMI